MPYNIYSLPFVALQSSRKDVRRDNEFICAQAMHVLTDTEKTYFNDRGWLVCDFKWSGTALVKQIGSMSVEYIELRLEDQPYRFVGGVVRISEQIPTAHGMFTTSADISSVTGDTLIECCDKLMDELSAILSSEKEHYSNYMDNLIADCIKEKLDV